ncbi:hypothetical protein PoB_004165900 [Plakobranchus ocellatus]|uniref:Uncharacterized protein n=1 Tax=Plakobranchus ocellatus TaxID=259542 RepID=A0AAV4B4X6_9GAST|nr:hypothetical protein PoB_004165900 [Plakobranchus ocellatus]
MEKEDAVDWKEKEKEEEKMKGEKEEVLTEEEWEEEPVHNKVISGFQALRQARAPVAGLEPATEGSLQISGRTH